MRLLFFWYDDGAEKGPEGAFLPYDDYWQNRALEEALEASSTWRELEERLDDDAFARLPCWETNGGDLHYIDGTGRVLYIAPDEEPKGESVHTDDKFEPMLISGFGNGEFPPFLLPMMDDVLPRAFCIKYGVRADSMASGSWWQFPITETAAMKRDLEKLGFVVDVLDEPR